MNWKPAKIIELQVKTIPAEVVICVLQVTHAPKVLLQMVSPDEVRGHAIEGLTVLSRAWNGVPHAREPGRRTKRTSAEEHPPAAGGFT